MLYELDIALNSNQLCCVQDRILLNSSLAIFCEPLITNVVPVVHNTHAKETIIDKSKISLSRYIYTTTSSMFDFVLDAPP